MILEKINLPQRVIDVAPVGGAHTLLLLEDGSVQACGSNNEGQLGVPSTSNVLSVSAGHSHSLFTAEDGIYFSGSNIFGQLCVDTAGEPIFTAQTLDVIGKVPILFDFHIQSIANGDAFLQTISMQLFMWGSCEFHFAHCGAIQQSTNTLWGALRAGSLTADETISNSSHTPCYSGFYPLS